jgi:CRP-like cAMP-binding protein
MIGDEKPTPCCNSLRTYLIPHTSANVIRWDMLVILDIIASLIVIPLRIGFDLRESYAWLGPDLFMDLVFVADIVVMFFKSYDEDGEVIKNRELIGWRYLKGDFVRDIVSTFPIEYIGLAFGSSHPAYRANRLIRIARLADFLFSWEKNSSLKPSIIGILKSIFIIVYMSHFVGCVFHLVTLVESSTASFTSTPNFSQRSLASRYLRSFYWALVSLTGYNASTPESQLECIMAVIVTIVSIALFGTIIGTFGNLLTNLDSSKLYFRQKMDGINDYMKYKKIPDELADDVRSYYNYMWKSGKGLEQNDAVDRLPLHLRQKMNFHMNYYSIRGVYLFADVQDDMAFMKEIVKSLRPRIGLPNSYVVKKGELGTEMFFISRGELNVVTEEGMVVFTLREGMFFGEIALLYKTKRTASIVARTFCDMYILSKEEFAKVMRKFPTQSHGIKDIAKQRFDAIVEGERKKEEADREALQAELEAEADAEIEAERAEAVEAAEATEAETDVDTNDGNDGLAAPDEQEQAPTTAVMPQ